MGIPLFYVVTEDGYSPVLCGYRRWVFPCFMWLQKMGIPLRLIITASNQNNVICEFVNTGNYTLLGRHLVQTSTPAIDILKSSNLERLLYHVSYSDHNKIREYFRDLDRDGRFTLRKEVSGYSGYRLNGKQDRIKILQENSRWRFIREVMVSLRHLEIKL